MKGALRTLSFSISLLWWNGAAHAQNQQQRAQNEPPRFSLVQGFGAGLAPTVTRVGFSDWEIGLLNSGTNMTSFGFVKFLRSGKFMAGLGLVAFNALVLGPTSPGAFAAVAVEQPIALGLLIRLEGNAEVTLDGSTQASSAVLLGWEWR